MCPMSRSNRVPIQPQRVGRIARVNQPATSPSSLLTNLIGYWKLDEASGSRADSTSNVLTLTDINTVTQAVGKIGNAGQFTHANSEYLTRVNHAAFAHTGNALTASCWVYLDSENGVFWTALGKYASGKFEYCFQRDSVDGKIKFYASLNGASSTPAIGTVLSVGAWHHLIGWFDGSTVNIQIDGGTATSAALVGTIFDSDGDFSIGSLGGLGTTHVDGRIDEVGLWNRTLTVPERATLYNSGAGVTYPLFA